MVRVDISRVTKNVKASRIYTRGEDGESGESFWCIQLPQSYLLLLNQPLGWPLDWGWIIKADVGERWGWSRAFSSVEEIIAWESLEENDEGKKSVAVFGEEHRELLASLGILL